MPNRPPVRSSSSRAGWRPLLTGVALALVLLAVVGTAMAHTRYHAPFDAQLRVDVAAAGATQRCTGTSTVSLAPAIDVHAVASQGRPTYLPCFHRGRPPPAAFVDDIR